MGKNKLAKFADMAEWPHVFQYPFDRLQEEGFANKGKWREEVFHNAAPLVLELGCGKGEYTLGLATQSPDKDFIGIDIKGARIWSGAKESFEEGMKNVAFLRTHIELLDAFFAPGEVDGIWLTFPDPQMKKPNKRLTSTRFMALYRELLSPGGLVHLKTDSLFLYTYTLEMLKANGLKPLFHTADLYAPEETACPMEEGLRSIRTYYERQWLERGIPIKYLCFSCRKEGEFVEPEVEIEYDDYRSFNRRQRTTH
ncbi:MAG: tRNA (guanosine(46)-N7)-methyltransferase TrmB, partial [Tannerella sp.]|nr:tRNA (guanosine(46)-N7)-methyltransferase TrmB [Tannerella sp.]